MPPKVKISREVILSAAFTMTKKSGIDSVTAQSIAKELNCSIHPVYWVFEKMENLRYAIIEEAAKEYAKYYNTKIEGFPKYKTTGWNYIHFAIDEPQLFKLLFMTDNQECKAASVSNMDGNKDYVISLIVKQTGLSSVDANDLYVKMWIFAHGIATMLVTNTAKFTDDTISSMLTNVYQGILKNLDSTEDLHDKSKKSDKDL